MGTRLCILLAILASLACPGHAVADPCITIDASSWTQPERKAVCAHAHNMLCVPLDQAGNCTGHAAICENHRPTSYDELTGALAMCFEYITTGDPISVDPDTLLTAAGLLSSIQAHAAAMAAASAELAAEESEQDEEVDVGGGNNPFCGARRMADVNQHVDDVLDSALNMAQLRTTTTILLKQLARCLLVTRRRGGQ